MSDLTQQIRERLNALASEPPLPAFLHAAEEVTPEEIAAWQRAWDACVGEITDAPRPIVVLPRTTKWEPPPDLRDAAILAVLELLRRAAEDWTNVSETAYDAGRRWALEQAVSEIAEKLGIEADRG